jgi:Zn-dependent protease with chaperone function
MTRSARVILWLAFLWVTPIARAADTAAPGFNLFTVEQDIEIGKQAAAEAEKQLPLLGDASVDAYLNRLVTALAAEAPGAKYPYHAKATNDPAINAFALPGGPVYVNRGLILAARDESELAGVLAHEVSHVALRHGTHQASKAYLAQAGLGILGGLLGRNGGSSAQVLNAIGGLGLNAVFLKFSRDAESQADSTGAGIMARAGYDPNAMADFFEVLQKESESNPGKLATFLSDHPPPADREARIRSLAKTLARTTPHEIGGFGTVQASVKSVPAASPRELARAEPEGRQPDVASGPPVVVKVPAPASKLVGFTHPSGLFSLQYPSNWKAHASSSGDGATFYPDGGVVERQSGPQELLYGVIVSHYRSFDPLEAPTLDDATRDVVKQIEQSNPYLRLIDGSQRKQSIGDAEVLSVSLAGKSPVTGETEHVDVASRLIQNGQILYALAIAPEKEHAKLSGAFTKMVASLDVPKR